MSASNQPAPNLLEYLTAETVDVGVTAADWEQAVEAVGRLLATAGVATPDYTPAMKRTIRELGPYSVIAPGVAMPHARPEDGVLRTGFTLITLADPVEFGNQANDPVDIVLAFGATDKHAHVQALRQIAAIFGDAEAVAGIRAARTKQELLAALSRQN